MTETPTARDIIHDRMAELAKTHAARVYPDLAGVDPDATGGALFALLVDTALAYEHHIAAYAHDPDAPLGYAAGMDARQVMIGGLGENLSDIKDANPVAAGVNGWLLWRVAPTEAEGDQP
jgi:hypothetical protein